MKVAVPACEGCPDKRQYILYGSFAGRISCSIHIYGCKKGYESRVTPFCLPVAPNMGAAKPELERDGTLFYADNYTCSLHIGIAVDSLFRQYKMFVRNRVDGLVGYAVILVAVFAVAGAVVGKGDDQRVGTSPKSLKQAGQLAVDIPQCRCVRFFIVFRFTFHIVTVRVMDSGKVDIHEYTFVRRVIL